MTSAVFGSIRLMSQEDRCKAIKVLLGCDAFKTSNFTQDQDQDINIDLWPRLEGPKGRRYVEPDVLLESGDRTTIVEVKWHAPLAKRQLEQQIEAVRAKDGAKNVSAVVMLGEAGVQEQILDTLCFRRTWRDVSGELQKRQDDKDTPLGRWVEMMEMFLQETDMGRIFNGLPKPRDAGNVIYRFRKPGHPPWLEFSPATVGSVHYAFEENT